MKLRPLFLLLASTLPLRAQTPQYRIAPSCGPTNVKFSVKTDESKSPPAAPDTGKALVYFIEDTAAFDNGPAPTVRVGMDGSWIGAAHGNSWFAFNVDPGVHHLCANWQGAVFGIIGSDQEVAAAHFTAEAGKTYFFRMQNIRYEKAGISLDLAPIDSDEGQILIKGFAPAVFHRNK